MNKLRRAIRAAIAHATTRVLPAQFLRPGARCVIVLAGASMVAGGVAPLPGRAPAAVARISARPNVVLITADDMRPGDLRAMPFTRRQLAQRGVTFTDAIAPFSLCCPARASILTGQYAHNHGVRSNHWPNGGYWAFRGRANTLPVWLRRRGYRTAMVGKYLTDYARDKPRALPHRRLVEVPPGWSHWYGMNRGTLSYKDHLQFIVDRPSGGVRRVKTARYVTGYLTDIATDLITRYHRKGGPFFVWLAQVAPHRVGKGFLSPPIPATRDRGDFRGVGLPRNPVCRRALNEDTADKRGPMHARPRVIARRLRLLHQRRLESLKSLDRSVRRVVTRLKATGEFARTIIIFTSDNGFALGEHRLVTKDMPYDSVLKIPMIVNARGLERRYRPRARRSERLRIHETVTTVDVPATIVAAAGARPGRPLDGIDMQRPQANPDHGPGGDRAVLIESGSRASHKTRTSKFVGVRTNRWTWLGWHARVEGEQLLLGAREFYDRRTLPSQVTNIHDTARFPAARQRLASLTRSLRDCQGHACIAAWR